MKREKLQFLIGEIDWSILHESSTLDSGKHAVKHYRYLGLFLDLAEEVLRASHSVYKLSTFNVISQELLVKTFDTMVKSKLLSSSGLWGYKRKENCETEEVLLKFCKHVLGANRNATHCAIVSELAVYPLMID